MIGYSVAHRYCSDCYRAANYRPADYSEQADNFPDRCYSEQHCFVPELSFPKHLTNLICLW